MEQAISQAGNDQQQVVPMLEQLKALPKHRGRVKAPIADARYASENNVNACEQAKLRSLIAPGRQIHSPSLDERFAEPVPRYGQPAALEAMPRKFAVARTCVCSTNVW